MTVLLKDAVRPNLVQTLGGTPALVHGGPFANIAHGCSSLLATRTGLALGDVVVTEAGFGADLGAEKFFDIKCRFGGLEPAAAVVVATVRALKMHGGVPKTALGFEDVEALERGLPNLRAHVDSVARFGVPVVVALNRFAADTPRESRAVMDACRAWRVRAVEADAHSVVGEGCLDLADLLWEVLEAGEAAFRPLYPDEMSLLDKIRTVAGEIYGADGVDLAPGVREELCRLQGIGLGTAPVCIAKTQYSLSDDPCLLARPRGFRVTVREVGPAAGAGFVVVKMGSILTMPGLGASPAARGMDLVGGRVQGLF
jgi:formate--tetrahydrofolate ligase